MIIIEVVIEIITIIEEDKEEWIIIMKVIEVMTNIIKKIETLEEDINMATIIEMKTPTTILTIRIIIEMIEIIIGDAEGISLNKITIKMIISQINRKVRENNKNQEVITSNGMMKVKKILRMMLMKILTSMKKRIRGKRILIKDLTRIKETENSMKIIHVIIISIETGKTNNTTNIPTIRINTTMTNNMKLTIITKETKMIKGIIRIRTMITNNIIMITEAITEATIGEVIEIIKKEITLKEIIEEIIQRDLENKATNRKAIRTMTRVIRVKIIKLTDTKNIIIKILNLITETINNIITINLNINMETSKAITRKEEMTITIKEMTKTNNLKNPTTTITISTTSRIIRIGNKDTINLNKSQDIGNRENNNKIPKMMPTIIIRGHQTILIIKPTIKNIIQEKDSITYLKNTRRSNNNHRTTKKKIDCLNNIMNLLFVRI